MWSLKVDRYFDGPLPDVTQDPPILAPRFGYFFGVTSDNGQRFDGDVTVWLLNGGGQSVAVQTRDWLDLLNSWNAGDPQTKGQWSAFGMIAYAGPPHISGAGGISSFRFRAVGKDGNVTEGSGTISQTYTDLTK